MDPDQMTALSAAYAAGIAGGTAREAAAGRGVAGGRFDAAAAALAASGLLDGGGRLTAAGRSRLRVVLAGGVFDIIHPGHIHTLESARGLGDVLVVVVATDSTAVRMKKRRPLHTQEQRRRLVESLRAVDLCLIGQEGDIFATVGAVRPQVIALGYDQAHQEAFIREGCARIGLDAEVARLESPIPSSSSSKIEAEYGESIHGI